MLYYLKITILVVNFFVEFSNFLYVINFIEFNNYRIAMSIAPQSDLSRLSDKMGGRIPLRVFFLGLCSVKDCVFLLLFIELLPS